MMAHEKTLAMSRMTRTPKATGPEFRTISTSALPGEPTGTEGAAESSWKKNMARASGEARLVKIILFIVRRCGDVVGEGNRGRFEVRGTRFEVGAGMSGYSLDGGEDGREGWIGGPLIIRGTDTA